MKKSCYNCCQYKEVNGLHVCFGKMLKSPFIAPWQYCDGWAQSQDTKDDTCRRIEETYTWLIESWRKRNSLTPPPMSFFGENVLRKYLDAGGKNEGFISDLNYLILLQNNRFKKNFVIPNHIFHDPYNNKSEYVSDIWYENDEVSIIKEFQTGCLFLLKIIRK